MMSRVSRSLRTYCISTLAGILMILASGCSTPESTNQARVAETPQATPTRAESFRARRAAQAEAVKEQYTKKEYMIPMRDGVKLHTAVYSPNDKTQRYPFMMMRTPYSCRPYGEDDYRTSLGPESQFMEDGFIFVFQDVRGCYMS